MDIVERTKERTIDMKERDKEFSDLYAKAYQAGVEAGTNAQPNPMIVGTPVGGLFGTEIDYSKTTYYEPEGACGFAWVNVSPGNSPFANWLKNNNKGRKAYGGGVEIWISDYNQSVARKYAHATAMARVLKDAGIKAYASSRLD
jgi:hypothetical protein